MEPAFSVEQEITVDLDAYRADRPEVGDAVVFRAPANTESCSVRRLPKQSCRAPARRFEPRRDSLFLKRVVALPGDRLSIRDGRPVVNGSPVLTDVIQACHGAFCDLGRTITILPGHYFMMGDNSGASSDSRIWGPVPGRAIIGKVTG